MLEKTRLEMSNEKLPTLKTILVKFKDIANKVRTNPLFCLYMRRELAGCGYNWFGGILLSISDYEALRERVMKVLAVALNEAIQKKVDLVGGNMEVVKTELHQLLSIDEDKSLNDYFRSSVSDQLASMSSPLDMAKHLKKKEGIQWLVANIIQYQFEMKWNTDTPAGEPDDYTFYEFCDKENTTDLLKYIPRQAHVKATLYKKCRRESVYHLKRISIQQLCPTVYIRTADGWKSWRADKDEFNDVEDINTQFSWINSSILTFITENADEQSREVESLKTSLKKHTLYWAVLDDSDFMPGEKLKLKEIGRTQVYVGRANNGIQGRWLEDSKNHCKMMKTCLDNVCAMTTYDPLRLEGISLVDARLTLAKVRREETALFVIKTFGDNVEKAEIAQEKAEVSLRKAKASLRVTKTERHRINLEKKVAKRQEELNKAIAKTKRTKNTNTTKSEAEASLTKAEGLHLAGKRVNVQRKNIIRPKDYMMTWTPKNMGYGMNN